VPDYPVELDYAAEDLPGTVHAGTLVLFTGSVRAFSFERVFGVACVTVTVCTLCVPLWPHKPVVGTASHVPSLVCVACSPPGAVQACPARTPSRSGPWLREWCTRTPTPAPPSPTPRRRCFS
jgi:hypothetical protein